MIEKSCNSCKKIFEDSYFYKKKKGKFGLSGSCKKCTCLKRKIHYEKLGRIKYKSNPLKTKTNKLKNLYNLTYEEYQNLININNNLCSICKQPELIIRKIDNKVLPLSIDHNHITGKIRGLLCNRCNIGLGKFKDNIELLNRAIKYLQEEFICVELLSMETQ